MKKQTYAIAISLGLLAATPTTSAESFLLNSYSPDNDGTAGPVSSDTVLKKGVPYLLQVDGSYSWWKPEAWEDVTGETEEPQHPSLNTANGPVGMDITSLFALPTSYYEQYHQGSTLPIFRNVAYLQISLDGGNNWFRPQTVERQYQADHTYTFKLVGEGQPLQVQLGDSVTSDNYGQFRLQLISSVQTQSKESYIWYFGGKAGIDFNYGSPVALTDSEMGQYEGCAIISTPEGNLRFYTNGSTVWNKNHLPMPNGTGLVGNSSSTQSAIIVPKPESSDIYYIFTVDAFARTNGLAYSTVDMTLNDGLGDIAVKNVPLWTPTAEKITAVRHRNQVDFWVISHGVNNNTFHAYLVTQAGVSATPVVSHSGSVHKVDKIGDVTDRGSVGYLKASPDGSRLALAVSPQNGFFEVFDFDNETGHVSNPIQLAGYEYPYGVEFSPDGTKLYGSLIYKGIYQFDLQATDIQGAVQLVGSSSSNLGALQIAPDGNIYVARFDDGYLGVINNPNRLGEDSHYIDDGFYLDGRNSKYGLPTLFESFPQSEICQLYGVQDSGLNDSQLFTIKPDTLELNDLGERYPGYDLEALDTHPDTDELYAASGDDTDRPGYLYKVSTHTGELTEIGSTGFVEIEGLSFDSEGTLWAWAKGDGLSQIDTQTGIGTLMIPSLLAVEDITWNNDSTLLYAAQDTHLWVYDGKAVTKTCDLPGHTEALEMLPDNTLLVGIHGQTKLLEFQAIDLATCETVLGVGIPTDYDDMEGIAWPAKACAK